MTNKKIEELLPVAKSWNNAPGIRDISSCSEPKYVQEERAYHLAVKNKSASIVLKCVEEVTTG